MLTWLGVKRFGLQLNIRDLKDQQMVAKEIIVKLIDEIESAANRKGWDPQSTQFKPGDLDIKSSNLRNSTWILR